MYCCVRIIKSTFIFKGYISVELYFPDNTGCIPILYCQNKNNLGFLVIFLTYSYVYYKNYFLLQEWYCQRKIYTRKLRIPVPKICTKRMIKEGIPKRVNQSNTTAKRAILIKIIVDSSNHLRFTYLI